MIPLVALKLREFNNNLWIAALDFEKAFDSISHGAIWEALRAQKVVGNFVTVLEKAYSNLTGSVLADKNSQTL